MRNRDLLERIDRHLDRADERWAGMDERWASMDERSDARWASIEEEIRLTREEVKLSREQRDRHAEMFTEMLGDLRIFTRDMMTRMERVTQNHGKGIQLVSEELRASGDKHAAAMRDLHEESVAHRQALLKVLDRLGPGESPSAA